MKRILVRIVIFGIVGAIVLFVGLGAVSKLVGTSLGPPKLIEAPWVIQTSSRVYYGAEFSMIDGSTPALKNYWTLDEKTYKHHSGIISFPESMYGKVAIVNREASK